MVNGLVLVVREYESGEASSASEAVTVVTVKPTVAASEHSAVYVEAENLGELSFTSNRVISACRSITNSIVYTCDNTSCVYLG